MFLNRLKYLLFWAGFAFFVLSFSLPNWKNDLQPIDSLKVILETAFEQRDSSLIAKTYQKIGDYYHIKHDFSKSFNYYEKSLNMFGVLGDSLDYYLTNQNFASYHLQSEQYFEAKKIHKKALKYYLDHGYKGLAAKTYLELAKLVEELGNHETVLKYLAASNKLNTGNKDTILMINNLIVQSSVYEAIEYNEKAAQSLRRANELSNAIQNNQLIERTRFELAILFYFMGKYQKAIDIFEDLILRIASHTPKLRRRVYKYLSKSYKATGQFDKAYPFLEKYTVLNDSILNVNRLKMVNKLTIQYQSKQRLAALDALKKEHKIGEIRAQKQLVTIYSFLVGLVAILISIYFLIRFYQQKLKASNLEATHKEELTKKRIMELQKDYELKSMHSMLSGQEVERERIAQDLHDSLGGLLSTVKLQFDALQNKITGIEDIDDYKNVDKLIDEACQEVRNISNNMQPTALAKLGLEAAIDDLANRFQGENYPEIVIQLYGMDFQMESTQRLMIYRIIQELLINALKHANATDILVQITRQEDEIIILVEDDGDGYVKGKVRKGMGTSNIESRVQFLKGILQVDTSPGKGTSVLINIPFGKVSV